MKNFFIILFTSIALISKGQDVYLKDYLGFPLGASLNPNLLEQNLQYRTRAIQEFNRLTAENHMKMMLVHPEENRYDFSKADMLIDFANQNGKQVHGHTLVWHNQVPLWMKEYKGDTKAWETMLKKHIQDVVKHFQGKVSGWDVVNEAYLDDGSLRSSIWAEHIPDYIAKSFQWAYEADPNVLLFYNDYGQDANPLKMQAILNMIKDLRIRNIPIHGLGLQMHININSKDEELIQVIQKAEATGLLIHFSELDIAVNPKNQEEFVYDEWAKKAQESKFKLIFTSFQHLPSRQQYGITFWNVGDKDSWLRGYFKRPKEYPLLFDEKYERKAAYFALLNLIHHGK